MKARKIITTGFAMFAMLFGAGNVIFPLTLGRDCGHQLWFGLAGFLLAAILMPLIGLLSTMLSGGDYKSFLAPLGQVPGFVIALVCMVLVGPFALIPRCIAISHAAIKTHVPWVTLFWFSLFCTAIIFACTVKRSGVIDLLGKYLGPLKLTLLLGILAKGLFAPAFFAQTNLSKTQGFAYGLLSGFGTCDLLATIFLSVLILSGLRKAMLAEEQSDAHSLVKWGLLSGIIGTGLLGIVYAGFCLVAAFYGQQLAGIERGDIFSTLAVLVLGQQGGFLANVTVAISCITTAIALTVLFATYLHKDLSHGYLSYVSSLLITIVIAACMSNLGFRGIMHVLDPVIKLIYPALCTFAVVNIFNKLWGFKYVRVPVVLVLLITAWFF